MTTPNDAPREPAIDPSDPRWVDDVLERARRRAEQARRVPAPAPSPAPSSAPVDPVAAPPRAAAPEPRRRPPQARPSGAPLPTAGEQTPSAPVPRRRVEFAPLGEAGPADAVPAAGPTAEATRRARTGAAPAAATAATTVVSPDVAGGAGRRGDPATVASRPVAPDTDHAAGRADTVIVGPADAGTDDEAEARTLRSWLEWGAVIVGALVVAFLIRAVAFQAFYIPSESMEHTLEVKDRILVNKISYKLHDVNRGDIIVFEKPPGETSKINDLIKRVIALPGETIEQQGKDIYIDRGQGPQKLTEGYVSDPADMGPAVSWVQGCANPSSETNRCTIPDGHIWVMGDNRGHSHDSRMFGPIDEDLIVGRAFVKVWPLNKLGFL